MVDLHFNLVRDLGEVIQITPHKGTPEETLDKI